MGFALPSDNLWNEILDEVGNPDCPICHGLSWVYPWVNGKPNYAHARRCRCMKEKDEEKRQARYLDLCQLPKDAEGLSFSGFRVASGKKKYPCLKEARDLAQQMAEGTGDIRWLVLMAKNDRGKSHLAKCICKLWLERGRSARYACVPDLLIELRQGFKRDDELGYYNLYQFFCKVSLLVLDDLGMEHHRDHTIQSQENDWAMEQLESIVNNRCESELYLVVTTNKPMSQLSPRIASRLQRYPKSRIVVMDDSPEYRLWKEGGH